MVFTLHEAAAAIHGIHRIHGDDIPILQATINDLFHAIKAKELPANVPQRAVKTHQRFTDWSIGREEPQQRLSSDYSRATIARADLLTWCESRGIRQELLFSDLPAAEKPLHASERQSLLAIIRALAELHGIKPGSGAYRKQAEALSAALSGKGISLSCNEKTLAKHLKEAFLAR